MKRRREEERRALVAEWLQGGQEEGTFCLEHEISRSAFHRWLAESNGFDQDKASEGEGTSFLPVIVRDEKAPQQKACRIIVGDYIIIECDEDMNLHTVETAIRAAVAVCGPM